MPRTQIQEHQRLVNEAAERGLAPVPARPVRGECCGRGCDPCIWDYYERALDRWTERNGCARAASGR